MDFLGTQTVLVAIPNGTVHEQLVIDELVQDALDTEMRIVKGAAEIDNEKSRLTRILDRIEYVAMGLISKRSKEINTQPLASDYLRLLSNIGKVAPSSFYEMRLGASSFSHNEVKRHAALFSTLINNLKLSYEPTLILREKFFNLAKNMDCCVVEIQLPLVKALQMKQVGILPAEVVENNFQSLFVSDEVTNNVGDQKVVALKQAKKTLIRFAKEGEGSLNMDLAQQFHPIVADTLNKLVYFSDITIEMPVLIPVIYSDGSAAAPFPMMSLSHPKGESLTNLRNAKTLHVGMISTRHSKEMDPIVQLYLYRNQEVSVGGVSAEIDELCYQKAKEFLLGTRGRITKIHFYQTGFQPAVIGFYRALTEELMLGDREKPILQVIPKFFDRRRKKYNSGHRWH